MMAMNSIDYILTIKSFVSKYGIFVSIKLVS